MTDDRSNELLEKLICLDLHFRGVSQQSIALFLGKKKAHVNTLLKPLTKKPVAER